MDWLLQNWLWVLLALGAVWMFSRRGLAGYGMGGHGGHGGPSGPGSGVPPSADTSAKAIDPVSGHEVLTADAVTAAYEGSILYFESAENRRRFEAAPQQYARNVATAPQQQHQRHGCC